MAKKKPTRTGHRNGGPKTPEGKKRALANLNRIDGPDHPHRNKAGRPAAGASVKEWFNNLQDHTRAELEAVANDPAAPAKKVAAAVDWLIATSRDRTPAGQPINGPAVERIMDYTDGKPKQAVDVTSGGQPVTVKVLRGVSMDDL